MCIYIYIYICVYVCILLFTYLYLVRTRTEAGGKPRPKLLLDPARRPRRPSAGEGGGRTADHESEVSHSMCM